MIHGEFRLPPAMGKRLTTAIDAKVRRVRPEIIGDASADASVRRWPSIAQQRADALVELLTGGGTQLVTELLIHLRGDGASFDDGTPIPWSELEGIAPEAFVRALIHDADGRPINSSARRGIPLSGSDASSPHAITAASTAAPPNSSSSTTRRPSRTAATPSSTSSSSAAGPATNARPPTPHAHAGVRRGDADA